MSTLLHNKLALECHLGCPIEFKRGCFRDGEEHDVEVHATVPHEWESPDRDHASTWLGSGDTHLDAIADCWETLRVRSKSEALDSAVDHHADAVRGLL